MSNSKAVTASRQRAKKALLSAFGSKCCICSYDKCESALEFHHTDPSQKEFTIGSLSTRSFEFLCEEAKKCILVCSNCHREIHSGKTIIPQNVMRFDPSLITYRKYDTIRGPRTNSANGP